MADFLKSTLGLSEHGPSERLLYGNSIADWAVAGLLTVAVWAGLSLLRRLIAARYQHESTASHPTAIRLTFYLLASTRPFFVLALALYAGSASLTFPAKLEHAIDRAVLMLVLLQVGLWAARALKFYLEAKEAERGPDRAFAGSLDIITFVAQLLIWSLLSLVALENLGVNITALLAGLGVGGVAVALALQNVLVDFFASLAIALDKPFSVGDFLTIDSFNGTVERIGIKTTRVRSETGEQIILSNADILKSRVRNFGRAPEQRSLATIRVGYETPIDKLREIPKLLESIVRAEPHARFERCHLKTLGDCCVLYELSYFVQQPQSHPLLDLQQSVNFRIIDELRRIGVRFAIPTQRVTIDDASFPAQSAEDGAARPTQARA